MVGPVAPSPPSAAAGCPNSCPAVRLSRVAINRHQPPPLPQSPRRCPPPLGRAEHKLLPVARRWGHNRPRQNHNVVALGCSGSTQSDRRDRIAAVAARRAAHASGPTPLPRWCGPPCRSCVTIPPASLRERSPCCCCPIVMLYVVLPHSRCHRLSLPPPCRAPAPAPLKPRAIAHRCPYYHRPLPVAARMVSPVMSSFAMSRRRRSAAAIGRCAC
jgi:hypothetical protein